MNEFKWKPGIPKPKVPAEIFGAVLEQLDEGSGVAPQAIVEAARPRRSPIHALFEWNREVAHEKYLLEQARHYVDGLTVVRVHVETGEPVERRAYLSIREPGEPRSYQSRDVVLADQKLRDLILGQMERDLKSYVKRYIEVLEHTPALVGLRDALHVVGEELDRLAFQARRRPAPRRSGGDLPAEIRP